MDDIAFANVAGGSRPQMLTARSMSAELALFPLLGGDAVIASLTLRDPDILLERGADGAGNWQFAPAHRALFPAQSGTGGGGGGHHVEIRTVTLEGGRLTWQGGPGPAMAVGISHARWSAEGVDLPMTLVVEATKGEVALILKGSSGSIAAPARRGR